MQTLQAVDPRGNAVDFSLLLKGESIHLRIILNRSMKKTFFSYFLSSSLLVSCQSGKTIRVDSSQVTEYSDLTIRDLDEMSTKMFPKLMQSALAQSNDTHRPVLPLVQ